MRTILRKNYTTFPDGITGVGLLLLRIAAGVATILYGGILLMSLDSVKHSQYSYLSCLVLSLALIFGGGLLILGGIMPFAAIGIAVCMVIEVYFRFVRMSPLQVNGFGLTGLLLLLSILIALALLGPGAYSIDARLFGRRRIFIPASKKEDQQQL
ncbi:MAG: hypothetical protein JSS81_24345 [Acidobacteria bacterium]|nr:hypothetical protein [Acidobacteriota bacterium]MBS1796979.1 hypothetical protein [Acidobacteriota bacterium]